MIEGVEGSVPCYQKAIAPNTSMVSTINDSMMAMSRSRRRTRQSQIATKSELFSSEYADENEISPHVDKLNITSPLWRQSSSTWRHTSPRYSFSRDSRFKDFKASHLDIQKIELPSSMRSKSCTFGKGDRYPISVITLRNAKHTPSPDRYNLYSFLEQTRRKSLGKSFGIPWSAYKKVHIKHRKHDVYSGHFTDNNPPAIYNVRENIGYNKKKFTNYGRLKMFTQQMAELMKYVPGPVHVINERLQQDTTGLNERNFGFGERIDLAKPANDYPAPCAYNIKGMCDRFKPK